MKIGIVSNGYPPTAYGGVEIYSLQTATELQKRGLEVFVVCRESKPQFRDYEIINDVQNNSIVYRIINDFKNINQFEHFYINQSIDKIFTNIIEQEKPDIIIFNHLIGLSFNLPNLAHQRQIPFVFYVHDYWPICHRINLINYQDQICNGPRQGGNCYLCLIGNLNPNDKKIQTLILLKKILSYRTRAIIKKVLRRPNSNLLVPYSPAILDNRYYKFREALTKSKIILTPSQFVKNTLINNGYPASKIEVLPLGIDVYQNQRKEKNLKPFTFGFIGTIIPIKGVDLLIKAFREISDPTVCLYIYGRMDIDESYTEKIKLLVKSDSRIYLMGPFRNLERDEVYSNLNALVVPSMGNETYSLVAREAMARGIPVIASENGALKELIQPYENGLLFPIGDVNALRKAMISLIESVDVYNKIQDNLKKMTFPSIAQHVDGLIKIFKSVLEQEHFF